MTQQGEYFQAIRQKVTHSGYYVKLERLGEEATRSVDGLLEKALGQVWVMLRRPALVLAGELRRLSDQLEQLARRGGEEVAKPEVPEAATQQGTGPVLVAAEAAPVATPMITPMTTVDESSAVKAAEVEEEAPARAQPRRRSRRPHR